MVVLVLNLLFQLNIGINNIVLRVINFLIKIRDEILIIGKQE